MPFFRYAEARLLKNRSSFPMAGVTVLAQMPAGPKWIKPFPGERDEDGYLVDN